MLTTFNEADMSAVTGIRKKHQDHFIKKHDVKLGFMSFFTKAVTMALQQFPEVNSYMDQDEIVTPGYCDIGIAVQTEKGLMVPIIRNTETLGLADIEKQILDIAGRARKNRISMDELTGGTFTITNGGIFGSMLSTPILNPPQSAILGMHNILERPVAVDGKVEIRPMMYLALSYDHRVIDGKNSVGFLKAVKEYIENPASMLFGTNDPEQILLELNVPDAGLVMVLLANDPEQMDCNHGTNRQNSHTFWTHRCRWTGAAAPASQRPQVRENHRLLKEGPPCRAPKTGGGAGYTYQPREFVRQDQGRRSLLLPRHHQPKSRQQGGL